MTTRILILGQDVNTVDYSHPAIAPGMNAEVVLAGLARAKASLEAQGFTVDMLQVQPDPPQPRPRPSPSWPARPTPSS